MQSTKLKLIIVVGPTASGKSELAVRIAKKFNGEIISADSRQIYRGLDIGTGKVTGAWQKGTFIYKRVPHYCIDFVDPKKQFSVAEFKQCAESAIKDIIARGRVPILAGGTGFWINAVVYNFLLPSVAPNQKLRKILEKKTAEELFKILQKLDPRRASTIERKNPRRIIRAIEIAKVLGRVPDLKKQSPYQTTWIGVQISKEQLQKKISQRLQQRLDEGMVNEARQLRKKELSWKRFYELGLEYRFLAELLRKRANTKETVQMLEHAIFDYARRQMTWFKKNKDIQWIQNKKQVFRLLKNFKESCRETKERRPR